MARSAESRTRSSTTRFGVWVNRIRTSGAFVWLIFDACHSGTMTRGSEVERQIPMSELIPEAAIAAAGQSTRRANPESDVLGLSDSAGGIAALYAAQMAETTPEKPLPNPNEPGAWTLYLHHRRYPFPELECADVSRTGAACP